jgi:glycosyltransferase involved in cell wall biosynthesis
MRILLITQEIDENSALLGVILTWIRHLAPKVDHIAVLALSLGEANLPANVSLYSMGKERSANKLFLLRNFYGCLWRLLRGREVDLIFVHMVPRYAILAAPLARLFGIPIVLWNAHGTVSRYLRIAHRLVAAVVTASPESFRIDSPKRIVTGHGIDTDFFTAGEPAAGDSADERRLQTCATGGEREDVGSTAAGAGPVLLTVGRLSRSKDYGTIIRALATLHSQPDGADARLRVIGTPFFPDDHAYLAELKDLAKELGLEEFVNFAGKVPNRNMVEEYRRCDVLINSSHTGSIDKVVLEAMACEKPAITCNESFAQDLKAYADLLMFAPSAADELAQRLAQVLALDAQGRSELGRTLRQIVIDEHSVVGMTDRFVEVFKRVTATTGDPVSSA